ncbi:MAG: DUF349 domain-containing protein [Candidatus Nanopelagicales bacterium]
MSDNWEPEVVEETAPPVVPFGALEGRPPAPAIETRDSAALVEVTEVVVTATDHGVVVVEEAVSIAAIPLPGRAPTPAGLRRPTPSRGAESLPPQRRTDPALFGRIDDDGTAWLSTPEGDVVVGNWAAGTREEGLAFFGRKFDDIQVEVDLAAHRLREGRGFDTAKAAVEHARAAVAAPAFIGDVTQLAASCAEVERLMAEEQERRHEARRQQREESLAAREALVVEAESLSGSRQWKATGERFAALLEAWKSAPRIDRGREQALWKRFSTARTSFERQRRQHFATLEVERRDAVAAKEKLVAEARALSASTQWADTSRAYRDLMTRWKSAGHAGRQDEQRLWGEFRAAQDAFFAARDAANAERDSEFQGNLERKLALVAEAETLLPIGDIAAAKRSLRGIQDRWESIGHVPRGERDRVEGRLRAVEEAIRKADQQRWKATNPEVRARAEDTAAKFRTALERSEAALTAARATGDPRAVAEAERSVESTRALLAAVEGTVSEFSGGSQTR